MLYFYAGTSINVMFYSYNVLYNQYIFIDVRTRDWFLLQNDPRPVWIITVAYLLFVWVGPKIMRNREAYKLNSFMMIYNLALVALSLYMFVEVIIYPF